ncbi:KIF-binding protein-like [Rhopilema esculentum]|uniref:KIF-binding protein-like n=1 Tax=Rhopilema esculentum TaxID=499914 RepID=UPI0031D6D00F
MYRARLHFKLLSCCCYFARRFEGESSSDLVVNISIVFALLRIMAHNLSHWLDKVSSDISKARELSDVASKNDPETNPYKSKYEARKILKDVLADLEEQNDVGQIREGDDADDRGVKWDSEEECIRKPLQPAVYFAALEYELAVNFVETEEIPTGEEHFDSSLNYLKNFNPHSPCVISLMIAVKCQQGILWSNRSDHTKALIFIQEAEALYEKYKASVGNAPLFYKDILVMNEQKDASTPKERESEFEKQHTLTLYYIAQSYSNLGKREESGKYCHITLLRQMETAQYDPQDWALNCATLGQYYITKDKYNFSRYCLACASRIGEEALSKFNPENYEEGERQRAEDKVHKMEADIARCWAKYCLNLLIASHEFKIENSDESGMVAQPSNASEDSSSEDDLKHLRFKGIEVTSLEEEVTDKLVKTYDEARNVFLCGQKWLQKAKEFYIFDGYVSDFVEINQDLSQLFKYLAFFDDSFERRCKMHKRRIDLLNAPLIELNPKHFLQICRQLTFEIAEIYSFMADLKKAILEQEPSRLSAESVNKFNRLLAQGIKYYQGFIDSYIHMDKQPEKYEDDAVRGVLLSHFYMARLHSKYLSPDKRIKAEYLQKEKDLYEAIVKYCDSHPDMPNVFEEELSLSREMISLFPAKLNQLLDS